MTNLLFVSYSSKISSNRVNVALPYVGLLTSSVLSATSKQCFELTSSVSSTTSKQRFEQPAASFLVCSLIFIEYKHSGWIQKKALPELLASGKAFSLFF